MILLYYICVTKKNKPLKTKNYEKSKKTNFKFH